MGRTNFLFPSSGLRRRRCCRRLFARLCRYRAGKVRHQARQRCLFYRRLRRAERRSCHALAPSGNAAGSGRQRQAVRRPSAPQNLDADRNPSGYRTAGSGTDPFGAVTTSAAPNGTDVASGNANLILWKTIVTF